MSIPASVRHTVIEVIQMKKSKGFPYEQNPMVNHFPGRPESCFELVNRYGTYNIQPTADTRNPFPAIAQGLPRSLNCVELTKEELFPKEKNEGR